MAGEYEPRDSRKVTGTQPGQQQQSAAEGQRQQGNAQMGGQQRQPGQQQASQQQAGQQGGGAPSQQQQFQPGAGRQMGEGGRMGGGQSGWPAGLSSELREHMEVIGADGVHVGTIDAIEGNRIKLTKRDSGAGFEQGSHAGHHHYLPLGLVAGIEGDKVRLSANGREAYGFEEEK